MRRYAIVLVALLLASLALASAASAVETPSQVGIGLRLFPPQRAWPAALGDSEVLGAPIPSPTPQTTTPAPAPPPVTTAPPAPAPPPAKKPAVPPACGPNERPDCWKDAYLDRWGRDDANWSKPTGWYSRDY